LYIIFADLYTLDKCTKQLAFREPVYFIEAVFQCGGEVFQASDDQTQFGLAGLLIHDLLFLVFEITQALAQTANPWLEFLLLDETLGIAVNQTGDALSHFNNLSLDGNQILVVSVRCLQATLVLLFKALWFF
jgi:hypothetical protein